MSHYFTLKPHTFTWEHVIKKSRFIVHFARIQDEEAAQLFIEQISKQHHKANHNVFAYVLGDNDHIQRYSDNGEPSGTAGVPMLEVLKQNELHDVVAVVTRYFGGVKLGAGGLIRAYAGTVAEGLQQAGMVERLTRLSVAMTVDYKNSDQLNYWLTQQDYVILDTQYDTSVTYHVAVAESNLQDCQTTLRNLFANQITFHVGDETHFEIDRK
jgi:uncharacterized YigZ family protein